MLAPTVAGANGKRRTRISRWDRPKEPHDWRWVVGHIGRACITAGILMFGFVVYQLWGTGIQTSAAQDDLKNEFNQYFEQNGITPATIRPATSTIAPPLATSAPTTVDSGPAATDASTTTTSVPTTPPTSEVPVPQNYGVVKPGAALGEIRIPKIHLDFFIVAGVSSKDLGLGVGHFANTVAPGQLGNSALAGHRTSHLAPFSDLDQLKAGDEIDITTKLGDAYAYIVTDSLVVKPTDYHVVTDSDPTKATLTLITCTPKYKSSQRLVVHASLDQARSSAVGVAAPYYGQGAGSFASDTIPGDNTLPDDNGTAPASVPTVVATTSAIGTNSTATSSGATTSTPVAAAGPTASATSTTRATTAPATAGSTPVAADFADNAFNQGWFDDGSAWPHVIGWGALFGLIWFVCYQYIARRYRRLWLGVAVAIVPVIVVLYFFFENVNRLLPAAI